VYRLERLGRRFGKTMVVNILRGSKNEKIRTFGLNSLSTYGIMADMDVHRVRTIVDYLIDQRYLAVSGDEYPVVNLTERSREIIFDKKPLSMMLPKEEKRSGLPDLPEGTTFIMTETDASYTGRTAAYPVQTAQPLKPLNALSQSEKPNGAMDEGLLIKLKELRTRLAQEARVPAYVIFSDASLRDMYRKMPETPEQFLNVLGVGSIKVKKYGDAFTAVIRDWKRSSRDT
jgi:ATP-dependent DNA helicase RecQ